MKWYHRLKEFLQAVWNELKKTTWPARREVVGTTVVVIVTVILLGAFLAVADYVMRTAIWWALGIR
jgi:preprotein translocase subunit SecE